MSYAIFVTGGSGFIGSAFVRCAREMGHEIRVLTRTETSATWIRSLGATPILGDLQSPGPWQSAAGAAEVVVHLAQPETFGQRITLKRARRFRDERLKMDANLLDSLRVGAVYRVIYVAGSSYYGEQGPRLVNEDATPHPKGWGPYIAPAIEALDSYLKRGLPLIQAFPAWVYGPGSWFAEYQLEPLRAGKQLINLRGPDPTISVVHVEDVARALLHLIDQGEVGERYFIADDRPLSAAALAELTAEALEAPLRVRRLPKVLSRLVAGPIITESLTTEARLSSQRLKRSGYTFRFPTTEQGVPDVVTRWRAAKREALTNSRPGVGTTGRQHD